jgi:hypothetical protein
MNPPGGRTISGIPNFRRQEFFRLKSKGINAFPAIENVTFSVPFFRVAFR